MQWNIRYMKKKITYLFAVNVYLSIGFCEFTITFSEI